MADGAVFYGKAMGGELSVLFIGKDGLRAIVVPDEKAKTLADPPPLDPGALSPLAEKDVTIPTAQVERLAGRAADDELDIEYSGGTRLVLDFNDAEKFKEVFAALKRAFPKLEETTEAARFGDTFGPPGCCLLLSLGGGGLLYAGAMAAAEGSKPRVGRNSGKAWLIMQVGGLLGTTGVLAIFGTLTVLVLLWIASRIVSRPQVPVLKRI